MINQGPRPHTIPPSLGTALFGWVRPRDPRRIHLPKGQARLKSWANHCVSVEEDRGHESSLTDLSSCSMISGSRCQPSGACATWSPLEMEGKVATCSNPKGLSSETNVTYLGPKAGKRQHHFGRSRRVGLKTWERCMRAWSTCFGTGLLPTQHLSALTWPRAYGGCKPQVCIWYYMKVFVWGRFLQVGKGI